MGWKGYVMMTAAGLLALPGAGAAQGAEAADRIYARVVTAAGAVHEGFLVWGGEEAVWGDLMNGDKELPYRNLEDAERLGALDGRHRERSIEFLGFRISWNDDESYASEVQSAVLFGQLRALTVLDDRAALLTLRSGEEVEFDGGSNDMGASVVVDDPRGGEVELRWRDLDVVEFLSAPADARPRRQRLYGTVTDRRGNEFTGHIAWDRDERFDDEILDGEERGRERDIAFRDIAAIEREGYSASRVVLTDGREMVLTGSNDVDDDNRGIQVADPALGQVVLAWEDFASVRFHAADPSGGYHAYDGGSRLYGTVATRDGDEITGWIRWDNDEEYTWEILDGRSGASDFDVELGKVARIERVSSRSADVTLWDGRRFELEGSNDVDRGNRGIFIETEDGRLAWVSWDDFREVAFARP